MSDKVKRLEDPLRYKNLIDKCQLIANEMILERRSINYKKELQGKDALTLTVLLTIVVTVRDVESYDGPNV